MKTKNLIIGRLSVVGRAIARGGTAFNLLIFVIVGVFLINMEEIVDRPGWNSGNAMTFIFTGSGRRRAKSYDKDPGTAPLLHVESAPSVTHVPGSWRREVLP